MALQLVGELVNQFGPASFHRGITGGLREQRQELVQFNQVLCRFELFAEQDELSVLVEFVPVFENPVLPVNDVTFVAVKPQILQHELGEILVGVAKKQQLQRIAEVLYLKAI